MLILRILSVMVALFMLSPAKSQTLSSDTAEFTDLYSYFQEKYGFNHEMINGIQYYEKYNRTLNDPYFSGNESLPGKVFIGGKKFNNLKINYDIYEQTLIIEYQYIFQGLQKIVLNQEQFDAFELDGIPFKKLSLDEKGERIYQVISFGNLTCYIHWKKNIMVQTGSSTYSEYFTDPSLTCYLSLDGKLYPFKNKKTFVSVLPVASAKTIKQYLKKQRIHFNRINPQRMISLIEYASQTIQATKGK